MYQVSMRSYRVLTNVALFILSFATPYTSHIAFIMNQNWSGSSLPTPLNTGNFRVLSILTHGCMGEYSGEDGETSDSVGGGGMREILCLIKLITLLGETFASSSLSPHGGEIKGLVSSSALPSLL